MKKKRLLSLILILSMIMSLLVIFTSCKGGESIENIPGKSAYDLAVEKGYQGTLEDWLLSIVGETGMSGENGKSAYEIACENGFEGSEQEWLLSLQLGKPGADGLDGVGIESVEIDQNGDLIITLTNGETCNAGSIRDLINE